MNRRERRFVWDLDWNLLRTFMVIVQEHGITAAGNRLLLKQPTVSNALRRLEAHFGCQLIDRRPGYFDVTPAGRRLFAECHTMFATVSRMHSLAEEAASVVTGEIILALASHVVSPFFDNVLEQFHQEFPLVSFSLSVHSSKDVIAAVQAGDVSAGICLMHERRDGLEFLPLYREQFGYFCGRSHKFFGLRNVTLEEMQDEPYVSFETDQMSDALWPVALLRQEAHLQGKIIGTSLYLEEVRRLIAAGYGFGPLPVHVVENDVANGNLWPLPPYESKPSVEVYLVTDSSAQPSLAEGHLLRMIREALDIVPMEERTYPTARM